MRALSITATEKLINRSDGLIARLRKIADE